MNRKPYRMTKQADGTFAIVAEREGPYSFSPPEKDVVFELTEADLKSMGDDYEAMMPKPIVAPDPPAPTTPPAASSPSGKS